MQVLTVLSKIIPILSTNTKGNSIIMNQGDKIQVSKMQAVEYPG